VTKPALWRQFKDASKAKRAKMVSWTWRVMVETPEGSEWWFGRSRDDKGAIRADFLHVAIETLAKLRAARANKRFSRQRRRKLAKNWS